MTSFAFLHLARAVERKGRLQLARLLLRLLAARPVDQRVQRARIGAAAVAHHLRGLAGEGGEEHLAAAIVGDLLRQRRLARAGKAEEAEDLRHRRLQPARDGEKRGVLLRGKIHRAARSGEIGLGEIVALVEQRHAMLLRHRVGEAVAEVQARGMAGALAVAVRSSERRSAAIRVDIDRSSIAAWLEKRPEHSVSACDGQPGFLRRWRVTVSNIAIGDVNRRSPRLRLRGKRRRVRSLPSKIATMTEASTNISRPPRPTASR